MKAIYVGNNGSIIKFNSVKEAKEKINTHREFTWKGPVDFLQISTGETLLNLSSSKVVKYFLGSNIKTQIEL